MENDTIDSELLAACEDALDIIYWMSGSADFGRGGEAGIGWEKAQPRLDAIRAAIENARGETAPTTG